MLFLIWLLVCLVAVSLILLPLALWRHEIYLRYYGSRLVTCPEDHQTATVSIDARHAAATGIHGHPDLRLCDCSRWPERSGCDRACLPEAVEAEPYRSVTMGTKAIHHLPILLAAFAAWCMGAIWHSQYLFRTQWTDAAGLTRAQVKQLVWWNSPHLLSLAVCLLFAYGVAWLLTLCRRKGVLQGVLMAVLLCGAVLAASWYGIAKLPDALLDVEAGYVVLAALIVGAIVGGLQDRMVLRSH
jgi:hypothetical protein